VDAALIAAPSSTQNAEGKRDPQMHQTRKGKQWYFGMRPGRRRLLNPFIEAQFKAERVEKMKASIRAKVEHPFRVIKQQFGFTKVRYRGLAKNTAQIVTLFALSNLWMARRRLMGIEA
jgi:IS5 family transposase